MNCFYNSLSFSFSFNLKKKSCCRIVLCCLVLPVFAAGLHVPIGLNYNQMEHLRGEQYSEYPVDSNPRAYMTMRDYRNLPWQWQQPVERNPNPCRSMREYRDQWMSTPSYSVIPTYAPPPHPQYASLSQPQPPQPISPIEQAILELTKLVGDAVEEQKKFNAQLSQKIHTVENPLEQKLDGFQSEVGQQFDSLQCSISKLAQQLDHQGEENLEEVCLSDTMVEDHRLQQLQKGLVENFEYSDIGAVVWKEATSSLLTEDSSGQETVEGTQEPIIQPIPINLYPSATAQPQNSSLPVYILPTPAANPKLAAPAPKTHASPSLLVQNIRKLMVTGRAFATTSKTQAAAHIAWHSDWYGCWFGFGAPEPRHF